MRKIYTLALLVFIAGANEAIAQNTAIKINVLSPIVRTINVSVERKLGPESSLQLGFFYTDLKRNDQGFNGIGITPEFRYYLGQTEAINGLYIAPFVRYVKVDMDIEVSNGTSNYRAEGTMNSFGGGVVVGKQWVFKERITIDMFAGPRGMSRSVSVRRGSEGDFRGLNTFGGFGIRTGITFGVAF